MSMLTNGIGQKNQCYTAPSRRWQVISSDLFYFNLIFLPGCLEFEKLSNAKLLKEVVLFIKKKIYIYDP